jgi:thiamine biosynthesis lipoprotein
MAHHLTRRRTITMLAATAAGLLTAAARLEAAGYEWNGTAMGTDARVVFCGAEADAVRAAVAAALGEIERLERALSLFRADSEISRLNRDGILTGPSADMLAALGLGLATAAASNGLFDPTVQALWEAHVDWFAAAPDAGLPPDDVIASARAAVDWRRVAVAADVIRLGRGQRITLNGLGQGYVTDRVADLLRARGFAHVLVDLGEQRALAARRDGTPWLIARQRAGSIELTTGALATSDGGGCVLGAFGAAHHLFDPRSGRSAHQWRRVTVHHASAAVADALSTALYVATADEIAPMLANIAGLTVWTTDRAGQERRWASAGNPPSKSGAN